MTSFGVLGPLEVRVGDDLCVVHGGRERMLLALLLTAPGRVFSVPEIIAELWGEHAPRTAERTVQTYVSRLRASLPRHGEGVVATHPAGYAVPASPGQVDIGRFRRHASRGRRALDAGRPVRALTHLQAALALWRGEAFMEFDAPFAQLARLTLGEERLTAVSDRIDAELALGRGRQLVGELEELVARHPWQERPWAQLMTALYCSNRQCDALVAFQRARGVLQQELGVDPGPELQQVLTMVLDHDPRLLPAPTDAWWRIPAAARAGRLRSPRPGARPSEARQASTAGPEESKDGRE